MRAVTAAFTAFRIWPFLALAILQVLDFHSTVLAMQQGRDETNPLILSVAVHIGLLPAVSVFKIAALLLTVAYFYYAKGKRRGLFMSIPLYSVIFIYAVTVLNNYS
jgi:hypothetical protein